jgi:hypothetical protein
LNTLPVVVNATTVEITRRLLTSRSTGDHRFLSAPAQLVQLLAQVVGVVAHTKKFSDQPLNAPQLSETQYSRYNECFFLITQAALSGVQCPDLQTSLAAQALRATSVAAKAHNGFTQSTGRTTTGFTHHRL